MTPQQKLRHAILLAAADLSGDTPPLVSVENVDVLYEALAVDFGDQDAREEVRGGDFETDLPCQWQPEYRNYEAQAVAGKMPDGSWVGWTYWYGGGKHSDPGSIPWMDTAYELACCEEEKIVIVRTFFRPDPEVTPVSPAVT